MRFLPRLRFPAFSRNSLTFTSLTGFHDFFHPGSHNNRFHYKTKTFLVNNYSIYYYKYSICKA